MSWEDITLERRERPKFDVESFKRSKTGVLLTESYLGQCAISLAKRPDERFGLDVELLLSLTQALEIFEGLPKVTMLKLLNICTLEEFKEGDIVFHEGDPNSKLYAVLTGQVKLFQKSHPLFGLSMMDLAPFTLVNNLECFGVPVAVDGMRPEGEIHQYTAQCTKETKVLIAKISSFNGVIKNTLATTQKEILDIIQNMEPFKNWNTLKIHALAASLSPRYYRQDQVIFRQGEPSDGMYLLLRGSCQVVQTVRMRDIVPQREGSFRCSETHTFSRRVRDGIDESRRKRGERMLESPLEAEVSDGEHPGHEGKGSEKEDSFSQSGVCSPSASSVSPHSRFPAIGRRSVAPSDANMLTKKAFLKRSVSDLPPTLHTKRTLHSPTGDHAPGGLRRSRSVVPRYRTPTTPDKYPESSGDDSDDCLRNPGLVGPGSDRSQGGNRRSHGHLGRKSRSPARSFVSPECRSHVDLNARLNTRSESPFEAPDSITLEVERVFPVTPFGQHGMLNTRGTLRSTTVFCLEPVKVLVLNPTIFRSRLCGEFGRDVETFFSTSDPFSDQSYVSRMYQKQLKWEHLKADTRRANKTML
eukprot:Rmarinus@m.611